MVPVRRGAVVERVLLRHPLPPRAARGFDEWRHTVAEEAVVLAQVHHVQQHALVALRVLDGEVEPKSGKSESVLRRPISSFGVDGRSLDKLKQGPNRPATVIHRNGRGLFSSALLQPHRPDLSSDLKSVTSITYATMFL